MKPADKPVQENEALRERLSRLMALSPVGACLGWGVEREVLNHMQAHWDTFHTLCTYINLLLGAHAYLQVKKLSSANWHKARLEKGVHVSEKKPRKTHKAIITKT